MEANPMRIAALQMLAVAGDVAANLRRIEQAAHEAREKGAALLITPELAVTGYGAGEAILRLAEPADGEIARQLREIARRTGLAIVTGFAERAGDTVYNSALFVEGDKPAVIYRKSHLYGDYERALFRPERPSAGIIEFKGLKLGMLICYDVEFPENVRRLARAGAQAVLVPTALPASDHAAVIAQKMIPVRAFENQIFVAYVNHCGADERFTYAGLSGIAAPDGTLIAKAGAQKEALLLAKVEPADYRASAAANSYLADLRL
jgi:predicted amidohydrolase